MDNDVLFFNATRTLDQDDQVIQIWAKILPLKTTRNDIVSAPLDLHFGIENHPVTKTANNYKHSGEIAY